jgi:hypothetical protein
VNKKANYENQNPIQEMPTMKAVGLTRHLPISDPQSLVDIELPKPAPSERDLLHRLATLEAPR